MDADPTLVEPIPTESSFDLPLPPTAADVLTSRGANPLLSSSIASATEGLFIDLQRKFNPLVGREGYRALLQEAHRRAMREHPVLEKYPVSSRGNPFFGGLGPKMAEEKPEEVWDGLTALTTAFLDLAQAMGGRREKTRRWARDQAPGRPDRDPGRDSDSEFGSAKRLTRGTSHEVHSSAVHSAAAHPEVDRWRVLVLDPDPESSHRKAQALCEAPDFEVGSRCTTVGQVRDQLSGSRVDFIIADTGFSSEALLDLCRSFKKECVERPPHLVITGLPKDSASLLSLLEAGASTFTLEEFSVPGLRVTLRLLARKESVFPLPLQHLMALRVSELAELARGRGVEPDLLSTLTAREGEILLRLEKGLSNRRIGRCLFISEGTVKSHVHQILKKLKVRDREGAVRILQFQRAASGKLLLTNSGFKREASGASPSD